MAKYIARECSKCRDYFGVVISHPSPQSRELPIFIGLLCRLRLPTERLAVAHWRQATPRNPHAQGVKLMVRYLTRICPRCNGHVSIIMREPGLNTQLQAVNGHCLHCQYRLAWIVIRGNRGTVSRTKARFKNNLVPLHMTRG